MGSKVFRPFKNTCKLHGVLTADSPDADQTARVYAKLVQLSDNTSLSLAIRDATDDGKKVLEILCEHYLGRLQVSLGLFHYTLN